MNMLTEKVIYLKQSNTEQNDQIFKSYPGGNRTKISIILNCVTKNLNA